MSIPSRTIWQKMISGHLNVSKKPLIVILGPTASGKTAFSLEVAECMRSLPSADISIYRRFDPEIVNADSRQLYCHLDIGTAKITHSAMGGIPHHLLSVLDPKEKVTVGWYKDEATTIIDAILARGHIPLLVGGSMLYISSIIDGLALTGRGEKQKIPVPYNLLIFGLDAPRPILKERIADRFEGLLSEGWIEEVQQLLKMGYTEKDPGFESLGYREIIQFLHGKLSREKLVGEINRKTMQYVKRQRTWWRHDARIHWINQGGN